MLLGYLRTIFKEYYVKNVKNGADVSVLLTKPRDLDYELFIFKKYEGLMRHLLHKKEMRSQATLEDDLAALKKGDLEYMRWMVTVYRSEKKKILRSQIDLCQYVIAILKVLLTKQSAGEGITLDQFHSLCMEKTPIEREEGLLERWVHNPDHIFSVEDQFIRRRIQMKGYLKDLYDLVVSGEQKKGASNV